MARGRNDWWLLAAALLGPGMAQAVTVTRTVDPPGLLSVDGCGIFCDVGIAAATFTAGDFPPGAVITDVDVSITWFKTDGTCGSPGAGNTFQEETSFRIDGPGSNQILASDGTWSGNAITGLVTTVFNQAAAAIPSGTPVSGMFLPTNGNLGAFNGLPGASSWTLRPGDNGSGDPLCIDSYSVTVTAETPIIINELDADTPGTDALEFVELYDGGVGNVPLAGRVMVFYNGADDRSYAAVDLDGFATNANGYFVLGNAAVANVSFAFPGNTLQNGADAVALYAGDASSFPNGTVLTTANLRDALVYDTNDADDAGLLTLLLPGQPQINEAGGVSSATDSNQRCPNGAGGPRITSTYQQHIPTPGAVNVCPVPTDLVITKTDGVSSAIPGNSTTYTITASNAGPNDANGATVADSFPAACASVNWTCVGAGGGSCTAAGSGNINDIVNLPSGGSVTYTAGCAISAAASGSLSNTATVTAPAGVVDNVPGNNSATDVDTLVTEADVGITKTDGVSTAAPGGNVTYTITASNAGPSNAPGNSVVDNFPASLSCTWTCVGAAGGSCTAAGSGSINDTVNLPAGGSVTYTASCAIASAATGNLVNTASIVGPTTDPNPPNNSATDTDTLTPQADLAVTKDNGVDGVPGTNVVWDIFVTNPVGPSDAIGVLVTDIMPAACDATSGGWACTATGGASCGAASGPRDINEVVDVPVGGSVGFQLFCSIDPAATGTLQNTVAITPPAALGDPDPANNSATDIDMLQASANLNISKDNGVTTAVPGQTVSWQIVAGNAGPSDAPGTTISDSFPAACSSVSWTCTASAGASCTAAGSGDIADLVDLPDDGSVTYSAVCSIDPAATGTLVNSISITPDPSVIDAFPLDNTDTDSDTLTPQADLIVSKDNGVTSAKPGGSVTWIIGVSNPGPSDAPDSTVTDIFPALCTTVSWTCTGSGGGSCTANGTGNINDTVDLPAGGSISYSATCDIDTMATGTLDNTATAAVGAGVTELDPANNSASDSDSLQQTHDLAISKTDGVSSATPGQSVTWIITASNAGPSDAAGAIVTDSFPAACTAVSWTCAGAGGGTCTASGSGNITDTVDLPVGGTASYSASCTIDPAATGTLDNTATIAVAAGSTDPNAANNSATDSDTLGPGADLAISKVDQGVPVPTLIGSSFSYLLTVDNAGPSAATGVVVTDALPSTLSYVSNDCGASFAAPTLSWNIGTLAPGASASCTLNVTVATLGTISNTASLSSATADPTPANNAATSTLAGAQPVDVAITLTSDAGPALASGDNYTYTVTGSNLGVGVAEGLDFTLTLSDEVSFVSSSCGAVPAGNTLSWSVATLADAASTSCDITVVVVRAGDIQASASVSTATSDPDLINNSAELTVAVTAITVLDPIQIPALNRLGLLLLILLSAGMGLMFGRARAT